jgi:hypothetical protein
MGEGATAEADHPFERSTMALHFDPEVCPAGADRLEASDREATTAMSSVER